MYELGGWDKSGSKVEHEAKEQALQNLITKLETKDYKFLGYDNDWYMNPPLEIIKCREAKHTPEHSEVDCVHTYTCNECRITWKMDSGD